MAGSKNRWTRAEHIDPVLAAAGWGVITGVARHSLRPIRLNSSAEGLRLAATQVFRHLGTVPEVLGDDSMNVGQFERIKPFRDLLRGYRKPC